MTAILMRLLEYMKAEKCEFLLTIFSCLGYIIFPEDMYMEECKMKARHQHRSLCCFLGYCKMQAVLDWKQRRTVSCIWFTNFNHWFIHQNFSTSSTHFTSFLKYYHSTAQLSLALPFVCCRTLLPVCVYAFAIYIWMISVNSIIHIFIKTICSNVHLSF